MISVVIPIYNEEQLIDELLNRTTTTLRQMPEPFEIIAVDDGSTDGSLQKLISYYEQDHRIKVIELSGNFGHQAAYTAGMSRSKGEYTVLMDGDLQDAPELIADMYATMMSGSYDIVNGYRTSRKEGGFQGMMLSLFHKTFALITGRKDAENIGNFSMLNRKALNALLQMKEKTRYLPGLRSYIGFRQGFLDYEREGRKIGKPKMGFRNLVSLAADAIFSFSRLPIIICFYLGLAGVIIFGLLGLFMAIGDFKRTAVESQTLLIGLFFLGSVQLAFIGVLGEYVFKGYKEAQNRPMFFIRNEYLD
jgi:glycosyltransferase involved in cell wall biosynthesis